MLDLLKRGQDQKRDAAPHGRGEVIKVIEVVGTSTVSFDDAIRTAIAAACRSLRHVSGADVRHMTVRIEDGRIVQYRADLKVAFALDSHEDDD